MSRKFKRGDEVRSKDSVDGIGNSIGIITKIIHRDRVMVEWTVTGFGGQPMKFPAYTYTCNIVHASSLSFDNPNRTFKTDNTRSIS